VTSSNLVSSYFNIIVVRVVSAVIWLW